MHNCQNSGCCKKIITGLILFVLLIYFACKNEAPVYLSQTLPGQVEPLVTIGQADHKVLRDAAEPVRFPLDTNTQQAIANLTETFDGLKSPYGKPAGLAAPQIGIPLRIIIIQIPPEAKQKRNAVYDTLPPTVYIDPSYVPMLLQGEYKDWEGCYSIPDEMGQVERYNAIIFTAYAEDGTKVRRIARGFLARLLQHEIDHLNGKLYIDYHCLGCHFGSETAMLKLKSKNK